MLKVGILCATSLNKFNAEVLMQIAKSVTGVSLECIIDERPLESNYQRFKSSLRERRGAYVLFMSLYKIFRKNGRRFVTQDISKFYKIPFQTINDPASVNFPETIKSQAFDILVLLNGFDDVVNKRLFDALPVGVLAYHHGDLREYRGQPPALWELFNGENSVVSTIQKLNEWTDTGIPILEKEVPILKTDNLLSLRNRLYSSVTTLMAQALLHYAQGKPEPPHPGTYGTLYADPTIIEWTILQFRILRRKARHWNSKLPKISVLEFVFSELKIRNR